MIKKLIVLSLIFFISCEQRAKFDFKNLPNTPINHHLIAIGRFDQQIWAEGLSDAAPKSSKITLEIGAQKFSTLADDSGRFSIKIPDVDLNIKQALLIINFNNQEYKEFYTIKDLSAILSSIAGPAFTTGYDINDISLFKDSSGTKAVILSPKAALISYHDVDDDWVLDEKANRSVLLGYPGQQNVSAAELVANKNFALVSLSGSNELGLITKGSNSLISEKLKKPDGELFLFDLIPNLQVENPIDAKGDGQITNHIKTSFAHGPKALLLLDEKNILVSFTNYYQYAYKEKTSVVGPGIIALIEIKDNKISTKKILLLPIKNPVVILPDSNNIIWVSCAGPWSYIDNKLEAKDGGLIKIKLNSDYTDMNIEHIIKYENFSPSEPAILTDKIVIAKSYGNEIWIIEKDQDLLKNGKKFIAPNDYKFTLVKHWHDDIIFLGEIEKGLIAFSLTNGFFPFPFIEPIILNNPSKIIFRKKQEPGRIGIDYLGFNGWAISSPTNKIIPLDFLKVFGP